MPCDAKRNMLTAAFGEGSRAWASLSSLEHPGHEG